MDDATLSAYDRDAKAFANDWEAQPPPSDLHAVIRQFFIPGPTADVGGAAAVMRLAQRLRLSDKGFVRQKDVGRGAEAASADPFLARPCFRPRWALPKAALPTSLRNRHMHLEPEAITQR